MFIQHFAFDFKYILFSDYVNCPAGLSRVKRQKHITNQSKCRENSCQETRLLFLEIMKVAQGPKQRPVWNPISPVSLFKIYRFEAQLMKERYVCCTANLSSFLRKNLGHQRRQSRPVCVFLWTSTRNQIHNGTFIYRPDTIYRLLKDLQKKTNYVMRNILIMLSIDGLNLGLVM